MNRAVSVGIVLLVGALMYVVFARLPESTPAPIVQPRVESTAKYEEPWVGQRQVLNVSAEWSEWIEVKGDRCIWIDDVKSAQVEVKQSSGDSAVDWNTYHEKKRRKEVGDFGWIRIKSDGVMTQVNYVFRLRDQCG